MTDEEKRTVEAQIRGLIDGFAKAFRAKNIHGVMSIFAPGIVSFDLTPPLQCMGANALKMHWKKTFSLYEGPLPTRFTTRTSLWAMTSHSVTASIGRAER